jgi:hypothetical protein
MFEGALKAGNNFVSGFLIPVRDILNSFPSLLKILNLFK